MRRVALIVLTLLATLVSAPAAEAAEHVLEDAADDVTFTVDVNRSPNRAPPAGSEGRGIDVLSIHVEESLVDLVFVVTVQDLSAANVADEFDIDFRWGEAAYRVEFYRIQDAVTRETTATRGGVLTLDAGAYREVATVDHEFDVEANEARARVPKALLLNEDDRIPLAGDTLTDLRVSAYGHLMAADIIVRTGYYYYDRMPDEGVGLYTLHERGDATGHLLFEAPDPIRVSNGGAMTIIFSARVHNEGAEDDVVTLEPNDLPERWTARVLSPVSVPAGGEAPVLVIASIPFEHRHGGLDTFTVTARSGRVEGVMASTTFGVLHTHTPMPSGHHPDLFLHAVNQNPPPFDVAFPWAPPFMSTEPAYDADVEDVRARFGDERSDLQWNVPLAPDLAIGLDFDTEGTGTLVGSLLGRNSGTGTVAAWLYYGLGGGDDLLLAEAAPQEVTLHPTEPSPFALEVRPTKQSDYVPYQPGKNLRLVVGFSGGDARAVCCPPHTTASLVVRDFKLTLPLHEYHDRVPIEVAGAGGVALAPEGPVTREARPGHTLTFPLTLTNRGLEEGRFVVELAGRQAEHATLVPATPVTLQPLESRRVLLGVTLPADAGDGERFEVLAVARGLDDASATAVVRTLTTALAGAESADESEVLRDASAEGGKRRVPTAGALPLLAALAALAVAARGRR